MKRKREEEKKSDGVKNEREKVTNVWDVKKSFVKKFRRWRKNPIGSVLPKNAFDRLSIVQGEYAIVMIEGGKM